MCKFHAWWDSGKTHINHSAATDTNVLNDRHDRRCDLLCNLHHGRDQHDDKAPN